MSDQFQHFRDRIIERKEFMSNDRDACNGETLIAFARYMLPESSDDMVGHCKDEAEKLRVRELMEEGYKLLWKANDKFGEYVKGKR